VVSVTDPYGRILAFLTGEVNNWQLIVKRKLTEATL
jgi:hypothetical protein